MVLVKKFCVYCGRGNNKVKNNYEGNNRRFHKECEKSISIYENIFNCNLIDEYGNEDNVPKDKWYDNKKNYNYCFKATKKTPTNDYTRQIEYTSHMNAKKYARENRTY